MPARCIRLKEVENKANSVDQLYFIFGRVFTKSNKIRLCHLRTHRDLQRVKISWYNNVIYLCICDLQHVSIMFSEVVKWIICIGPLLEVNGLIYVWSNKNMNLTVFTTSMQFSRGYISLPLATKPTHRSSRLNFPKHRGFEGTSFWMCHLSNVCRFGEVYVLGIVWRKVTAWPNQSYGHAGLT